MAEDDSVSLPEELNETDETVCRFCGISYLIHRQVKKLQQRCDELEAEFLAVQEFRTEAPAVRQALAQAQAQEQTLKERAAELESRLEVQKRTMQEHQDASHVLFQSMRKLLAATKSEAKTSAEELIATSQKAAATLTKQLSAAHELVTQSAHKSNQQLIALEQEKQQLALQLDTQRAALTDSNSEVQALKAERAEQERISGELRNKVLELEKKVTASEQALKSVQEANKQVQKERKEANLRVEEAMRERDAVHAQLEQTNALKKKIAQQLEEQTTAASKTTRDADAAQALQRSQVI